MQCMIGGNGYGFYVLADIKEMLPLVIEREKENLKCLLSDDEAKSDARKKIMEEIESRNPWWFGLNYNKDDYIQDEQSHISFLEAQLKNVVEMEKSFNGFEPMFHRFGELITTIKSTRQPEDRGLQILCFVGSWQSGFRDTKQLVEFLVKTIKDKDQELRSIRKDAIQTKTELGQSVEAGQAHNIKVIEGDVAFLKNCLRDVIRLNISCASFEKLIQFIFQWMVVLCGVKNMC